MLLMLPAVAVKVAAVAPDGTVTEAGTVSKPLLLDSDTDAPPAGATWDKLAVQVDVPPLLTTDGAHDRELITAGAVRETVVVFDPL